MNSFLSVYDVFREIIGADFDVIDEIIAKIDGCRKIRGYCHVSINNEADMVSPWSDGNNGGEDPWLSLSKKGQCYLFIMLSAAYTTDDG